MRLFYWLLLLLVAPPCFGQSGAEWRALKKQYGLPASLSYNEWVNEGCPVPNGNGGGLSAAEIEALKRQREAHREDQQGVAAANRGNYGSAISAFKKALGNSPNDPVIRRHLAEAEHAQEVGARQARLSAESTERFEQAKSAALGKMKGVGFDGSGDGLGLKGLKDSVGSEELKGLDAGGVPAARAPAKKQTSEGSLGPNVVDARNVPSGLPKAVEDAIASAYASAPPGVIGRVRKGFEAVMVHDWKGAAAWFKDALNHDPDNVGLKHLVALAGPTEGRIVKAPAGGNTGSTAVREQLQLPRDSDLRLLFPGLGPAAQARMRNLPLPKASDWQLLFPGLPLAQARAMNEYMMDHLLKETETDPQLLRVSRGQATGTPAVKR